MKLLDVANEPLWKDSLIIQQMEVSNQSCLKCFKPGSSFLTLYNPVKVMLTCTEMCPSGSMSVGL